ncbi:efflux RND transporter periplasmic adaptor subunit [Acidocella sp.]|jgi:RND family efflux transporter MFP subunit|uniref:efflux RND transporter periplasmic adaptor subunit n=1 Tax=Acidocella sp. TaxID=50710 RepID=UPI002F42AC2B
MPEPDALRYTPPKRLKLFGVLVLLLAICVIAFGLWDRSRASQRLVAVATAEAVPTVNIVQPALSGQRVLVLPGDIRAFYEAPIYAQVSGYLQNWDADIGTRVKAGQLLADISTPDLDQQLLQAQADLQVAVANERLAAVTAKRWNALLAQDAVSQQDADNRNSDWQARIAEVAAAKANVQRLQAMEVFKKIVAPFDGVVTSRSTDIGALISVGTPNQTPLFTVDDEERLRIYVNVPQSYTADVKSGMQASFTVPQYPQKIFHAVLTSTADAIATNSGTLLVQFQMTNTGGFLRPGDYAQVHIALSQNDRAITVPASALLFRDAGMEVAVLGPGNHVMIRPVSLGRNFGATVEIENGIDPDDWVIDNPPDTLEAGDVVQAVKLKSSNASSGNAGS